MNKATLVTVFTAAATLLFAATAGSQETDTEALEPWYQFELLIFEYTEPQTEEILRKSPFKEITPDVDEDIKQFSFYELYNPQPEPPVAEALTALEDVNAPGITIKTTPENAAPIDGTEPLAGEETVERVPELLPVADSTKRFLSKYEEMLRYRRQYRVLQHIAWQQPLPANSEVRQYQIATGPLIVAPPEPQPETSLELVTTAANDITSQDAQLLDQLMAEFIDENSTASDAIDMTLSDPLAPQPTPYELAKAQLAEQAPYRHQLEGAITVYRKNFAHIIFDIWFAEIDDFTPPQSLQLMREFPIVPPPTEEATALQDTGGLEETLTNDERALSEPPLEPEFELYTEPAFTAKRFGHINEDRRMRSTELYYVDHPLFGVILQMEKMPHPLAESEAVVEQ